MQPISTPNIPRAESAHTTPSIDLAALPRTALLPDTQAAAALGVSKGTLAVWRSTGRYNLPFVKCGRLVRYRVGDILDFLEARTCHGHGSAGKGA